MDTPSRKLSITLCVLLAWPPKSGRLVGVFQYVNGVSRLHGKVSRHILLPLFPHWPEDEVPIGHVTNGVHIPPGTRPRPTICGQRPVERSVGLGTTETLDQEIRRVSDAKLWQFRAAASKSLVEYARERLSRQLAASAHLLRRSKPPSISASLVDRPSCTWQESLRRQETKHAYPAQSKLDLSPAVRVPG